MTEFLKVRGLRRKLPDFTLEADFEIAAGERLALLGPSGSGKTTLLRAIAGLDPLESGEIRLGADDVTAWPPRKRDIGVVFQDGALFPALDVLENAAFALRMRGMPREEREGLVRPWLEKLALAHRAHADVSTLSGGERQRVAFIRAVAWKPRALLLDEPFSGLDSALREAARAELVELHKLWPVPLLLVTHDEGDVAAVATARLSLTAGPIRRVLR